MEKPDPEKVIDSAADDCADMYLFVYIMNMNKSLRVYTRGRQAQKKRLYVPVEHLLKCSPLGFPRKT